MRTGDSRPRREGSAAPLALLVLLALFVSGLAGCSLGDDPAPPVAPSAGAADVTEEVATLLTRRSRAVRSGNLTGFLDQVAPRRTKLRRLQKRYFLNLRELPLGKYRVSAPEGGVTVAEDGTVRALVVVRMQLEGFDKYPVESPARYRFVRDDEGTLVLAGVRDRAFEKEHDIELQPWELTRIEVVSTPDVLGVFDEESVDAAYHIVDAVEDGIAAVSTEVPVAWSQKVVVYALSDVRVLAELDNLPGGDPNRLDGVAFPVRANARSSKLAGTRFMLHPRMVNRDGATRARLIRHELTHVALGRRDDHVPTWLAEGLAEYVSVQGVAPADRMISRDAVSRARVGLTGMPADDTFNGEQSGGNYGIAWYACEYIVTLYGEEALWRLFDEMRKGGGTPPAQQDDVLRRVLGIDSAELARGSATRILATFG